MRFKSLVLFIFITTFIFACSKTEEKKIETQPADSVHKVTVIELQDVPSYTYLKVDENGKEYWIAVPTIKVEKGETLYFKRAMEMRNFESTTLKRTFKSILFVQDISKKLTPEKLTAPNGSKIPAIAAHTNTNEAKKITAAKIKKGKSELTVAKLYKTKNELNGKKVKFKGTVVKFNPSIMGKNWAHLEDGTKLGGNVDITVTVDGTVKVGETVTIEGTVKTNVDYGYGYSYAVMIQDAKVLK